MMMTLKRMFQVFREHVRAFLGTDSLPTRLEIIQLRDDMAKYHREVMQVLASQGSYGSLPQLSPINDPFQAPTLDWETMQKLELFKMMQNPPKED